MEISKTMSIAIVSLFAFTQLTFSYQYEVRNSSGKQLTVLVDDSPYAKKVFDKQAAGFNNKIEVRNAANNQQSVMIDCGADDNLCAINAQGLKALQGQYQNPSEPSELKTYFQISF